MKIIYTRPDGGVSVVNPCKIPGESEEECIARVRARSIPKDATDVREVPDDAIPEDRTFRNAWKADSGEIAVDIDKAKVIAKQRTDADNYATIDSASTVEELSEVLKPELVEKV